MDKKNKPKKRRLRDIFPILSATLLDLLALAWMPNSERAAALADCSNHPLIFFDPSLLSAERADPTHDPGHLDTDMK